MVIKYWFQSERCGSIPHVAGENIFFHIGNNEAFVSVVTPIVIRI